MQDNSYCGTSALKSHPYLTAPHAYQTAQHAYKTALDRTSIAPATHLGQASATLRRIGARTAP